MTSVRRARERWERLRQLPPWVLDAVIATTMVVTSFLSTAGPGIGEIDYDPRDGWAYLLILAATLPYYLRRRQPLAVLLASLVAVVVYVAAGYNEGTLPLVVLVGVYSLGAWCPLRQVIVGYASVIVGLVLLLALGAPGFGADELFANAAFFGVAALFGWSVQSRRLRLAALEERAEALEREQEEQAARAVADERLRIAQELHDVVAHSMSVIAVQAGAGMHVVEQDPAEGRRALEHISTTSRSTLTELRRLLGVLREDDAAPHTPAPGLEDLDRLAGEVTAAGVPVEVSVDGDLAAVPPGVGSTGYRIVQEALTNVLRHAGPAQASVRLATGDGHLRIEVRDDGRGVNGSSDGGGHGLLGMRERVAVYGGTLHTGPVTGGGFRVAADLPYDASSRVDDA